MNILKKWTGIPAKVFYAAILIATLAFVSGCEKSTTGGGGGGGSVPATDNTVTVTIDGVQKSGTGVAIKYAYTGYDLVVITGSVYEGAIPSNISTFSIYLSDNNTGEHALNWSSNYGNGQYLYYNNMYYIKAAGDTSLYWAVGPTAGSSGSATINVSKAAAAVGDKAQGTFSGTLRDLNDTTKTVTISGGFNVTRYY